jgi:hypothetical protein
MHPNDFDPLAQSSIPVVEGRHVVAPPDQNMTRGDGVGLVRNLAEDLAPEELVPT